MKPFVIAEIGCNHMGDLEIAKEMIKTAAVFSNVNAVKFQKRNNKEVLSEEQYNAPHPNPYNSYGNTYGEHREFLEFTVEQHKELKKYCEEWGLVYSTSVWDLTSAKEIASLQPEFIKIPSAQNNNYKMLEWLCDNYAGELQISVGMTSKAEVKELVEFLVEKNRAKDTVIYSCTSGYPVPDEDVCLLEITYLRENFGNIVKSIGFSGHHNGISLDIAAYTLGAEYFERHFTLNRTWKGTDHAASLEPDGMRRLVRNLISVSKALTYKKEDILDIEKVQRNKLKYDK
ncbi:N-acetylneuraminate synthase [Anaerocolumna cellulosilytica]|uniref:N-acetylneuraminate synthase n=1 Tax=Anaerocolumna cellulosilytica TaxID=433286 RepID=A0A6S6R005_9FIRM|nr:N-acetylneuraminate synthase family protein [Anaerocolumna cellulosilytica]MBB5195719.1 N-acetylneuraminate synthase [Anaerocolumna cellulosilytica]BCJ92945.1 N-acetylneuraminate synthase [Anaerocolumna cellulosilytica]